MDTSETYIKMSEHPLIQNIWKDADCSLLPSFIYDKFCKTVSIMIWTPATLAEILRQENPNQGNTLIASIECWHEKNLSYWDKANKWKTNTIWLPRQEDLQGMVDVPYVSEHRECQAITRHAQLRQLIKDFNTFVESQDLHTFTSMEQLWLAFVMKTKYQKTWDSEKREWVDATHTNL